MAKINLGSNVTKKDSVKKKTSIGKYPSKSGLSKGRKRSFKKYRGQGK